jgi:hypothetical protein
MPTPPLTHHDILRLAEPFVRAGRQVDLAASDRAARRIAFKPVAVDGSAAGVGPLQETLHLTSQYEGPSALDRTLAHPGGLHATLRVEGREGADPAELLTRAQAIAPQLQFRAGPGYLIAMTHALGPATAPDGPAGLVLQSGVARLDGLTMTWSLSVPGLRGVPADIELLPEPGERLELPEDLLAVQGWDWARLIRREDRWTSRRRLRGRGVRRSRAAEAALEQAARHLVTVLAEPPARFHERHRLARWGVVLRRGIPTLTAVGMIAAALLMTKYGDGEYAGIAMALHYLPIALLALAFSLQELAQFEIPPLPRRPAGPWRVSAQGGAA